MSTSTSDVKGFAHGAARGSWMCTIIAIVLLQIGRRAGQAVLSEVAGMLVIVAGLLLGVIALFGIPKYGVKGILGPALAGITINGLLILIFVTNFITARARAREAALDVPSAIVLSVRCNAVCDDKSRPASRWRLAGTKATDQRA